MKIVGIFVSLQPYILSTTSLLNTIEHFANDSDVNLIFKAAFNKGSQIKQADKQYNLTGGYNKIVNDPNNPTASQYYLQINPGSNGYLIRVNLKKNTTY